MSGTTNIPEVSVIIRRGDKMLFVQREHTGYCDGMYALPSGHVEADEPFSEAACRETLEEVGLTVKPEDLAAVHTMHRIDRPGDVRVGVLFEARKWTGVAKNMEPHRHSAIAWLPAGDLPYDKIIHFQAAMLRSQAGGAIYSERGWQQ